MKKELKSLGLNVELIETDPTVNRENAQWKTWLIYLKLIIRLSILIR